MAAVKPPSVKPSDIVPLPEQTALAAAVAAWQRTQEARRDAVATVERLASTIGRSAEHTASQVIEENIQTVPGTRIGKLFSRGLPPSKPSTATRADIARAKLGMPGAQEALIVAEADLLDSKMALDTARRALALRQFREALPAVTTEVDRLLAEAEAVASKAAAFTTDRLLPLLESCPLAGALSECRLVELEMLRDRAPKVRALLAALSAQYLPTNGGPE
jgi:hypothetical protein